MCGVWQSTAAVLKLPVDAERPAAERFNGKLRPEEFRGATCESAGALALVCDSIGSGHLRQKELVLEAEPGERLVIRQRHRGHGRRLRADQKVVLGGGRKPVIAVADVDLGPVEAETHNGSRGNCAALVRNDAGAGEEVVAGLHVSLRGNLKIALQRQAMLVWNDAIGTAVGGTRRASVRD